MTTLSPAASSVLQDLKKEGRVLVYNSVTSNGPYTLGYENRWYMFGTVHIKTAQRLIKYLRHVNQLDEIKENSSITLYKFKIQQNENA